MKILAIPPTTTEKWNALVRNVMNEVASPGTEVHVKNLAGGPLTIECSYQEQQAVPYILDIIRDEAEKYDGIIICCFAGPGIDAAKEITTVPVIGIGEAAQIMALPLGDRYGIITTIESSILFQSRKAKLLGTDSKLVSVRPLNLPVIDLENEEKLRDRIFKVVEEMIEKDRVDVVVLGCGLLTTIGKEIFNHFGLPVIVPHHAAIKLMEAYISMGISQSKRAFSNPLDS